MTVNSQRLLLAAAGAAAAGEGLYIDDVFSTFLYEGTSVDQTITNGIDLSGEGGMVWLKTRDLGYKHILTDSERGTGYTISSNDTNAQAAGTDNITSFNANGFTIDALSNYNINNKTNVSWTFRKAPGFFDVVTYTGTGSARTVAHNLGSVPGCILVKNVSRTGTDWRVWHRSLTSNSYTLLLNLTNGEINSGAGSWNNTAPTSTNFTVGADNDVNFNGDTHVAYIFAHDDQSFGEDGDESIIKCGTFTTDGSYNGTVTLGWEPQWVMVKNSSATGGWFIHDVMRGAPVSGDNNWLYANTNSAESTSSVAIRPNPTGFTSFNHSASTDMIYIAIRRPHKPPEAGTDVFHTASGTFTTTPITTGFPLDFGLYAYKATDTYKFAAHDRLRGLSSKSTQVRYGLITSSTAAENPTLGTSTQNVTNTSYDPPPYFAYNDSVLYSFRRAPGFFDMVAYTGTGSNRTVNHNLGVAPELMIFKDRTTAYNWGIFAQPLGNTKFLEFNTDLEQTSSTIWNNTSPSSSAFAIGTNVRVNSNGDDHIAYLFATLNGISKVGSYTGTGSNIGVDCGFTAGARFVLIKRTDSTGDWYVYDSTRGIVGGNDPYLLINSTAAEVTNTDYIDPLNSGFTVTSSAPAALNASGGTYIFLAIA